MLEVPLAVTTPALDARGLLTPYLRNEEEFAVLVVDFEGSSVMCMIVSGVRNSGNVSQEP